MKNIENEKLKNDFNFSNNLNKDFFDYIFNEINIYFKNNSKISLENLIKNIIDNSNNIKKTLKNISLNIIQYLNNISNKNELNNSINLNKNKISNEKDSITLKEKIALFKDINSTILLNDLKLENKDKYSFKKIIDNLKMNNTFNIIMNRRFKKKISEYFITIKGKIKENFVIPDENGNNYQYHCYVRSSGCQFLSCADRKCKGRGKIIMEKLNFTLIKPHTKNYNEHTYIIKNKIKNDKI